MNEPEQPRSLYHCAMLTFGVALTYFVTGKLSLLMAIHPGYATAVWPPAGIALAAALACKYRVWPSVLLGSFLVNVSTGFDSSSISAMFGSLIVPLGIAGGAVLQVLFGVYCVRRFAGFPNPLANERNVFSFLFWAGPISCIASAMIGTLVLLAAGNLTAVNTLTNFATWWIGDVIGVFIFTPLILVWILDPRELWKPRRLTVTLPILMAFALTVAAVTIGTSWERQRLSLQFNQQAAPLAQALKKTLDSYIGVLDVLEGFYAASNHVSRGEFRTFVDQSFSKLSGIQALSWNPRIRGSKRAEFERITRGEGFSDFQITERTAAGKLVRAAKRPEYISVHLIEPFKKNKKAFGFDVASNPIRKKALDQARDTGKPVASARITLVQEASR